MRDRLDGRVQLERREALEVVCEESGSALVARGGKTRLREGARTDVELPHERVRVAVAEDASERLGELLRALRKDERAAVGRPADPLAQLGVVDEEVQLQRVRSISRLRRCGRGGGKERRRTLVMKGVVVRSSSPASLPPLPSLPLGLPPDWFDARRDLDGAVVETPLLCPLLRRRSSTGASGWRLVDGAGWYVGMGAAGSS